LIQNKRARRERGDEGEYKGKGGGIVRNGEISEGEGERRRGRGVYFFF